MPLVYLTEEELQRKLLHIEAYRVQCEKLDIWTIEEELLFRRDIGKLQACLKGEEGFSKKEFEFLLGRPNKVSQEGAEKCTEKLKRYLEV